MTKAELINNPESCLNRAKDDEPVFLLRAQDMLAIQTVRDWANKLTQVQLSLHQTASSKVNEAFEVANQMQVWASANGSKYPD